MVEHKNIIISAIVGLVLIGGALYFSGYFAEKEQGVSEQPADQLASIQEASTQELKDSVLGNPDAPITIVEYFSYVCGHCRAFHQNTMPLIKEKYISAGKVKFIVRQAFGPAELPGATLCAGEQGRFWEYHEYLFDHLQDLRSADDLKTFAGNLNLDQEKFNQCFDSQEYKEQVEEWSQLAIGAGVDGVPTFFINDQQIVGAQPFEEFERVIEEILKQE